MPHDYDDWRNAFDPEELDEARNKAAAANSNLNAAYALPVKNGEDFEMTKVEWLWRGWLARGKLHLIAGAKGTGKSTVAYDLAVNQHRTRTPHDFGLFV